jgi:hypothetical protein
MESNVSVVTRACRKELVRSARKYVRWTGKSMVLVHCGVIGEAAFT